MLIYKNLMLPVLAIVGIGTILIIIWNAIYSNSLETISLEKEDYDSIKTEGVPEPNATFTTPDDHNGELGTTSYYNSKLMSLETVASNGWLNTTALKVEDLRGKVILIDFWTYSCVNCIRTIPYLKIWHAKYAKDGLIVIGIHTPEFKFEHNIVNVKQAIADYNMDWPVIQDNSYDIWTAFDNVYWPAKYLLDKNGVIRYRHFGEGSYDKTEQWIRNLLEETDITLSSNASYLPHRQTLDPIFQETIGAEVTDELYGGYKRGCSAYAHYSNSHVDHPNYCNSKDTATLYEDPRDYKNHRLYLQGSWIVEKETLSHGTETHDLEDYMLLRYSAKSVNIVLAPATSKPFKVVVTLDGSYLTESNKGKDIVIENNGQSFLLVNKPRLYSVVEAPQYGTYNLKLNSNSKDFALYAFTFGVYEEGI